MELFISISAYDPAPLTNAVSIALRLPNSNQDAIEKNIEPNNSPTAINTHPWGQMIYAHAPTREAWVRFLSVDKKLGERRLPPREKYRQYLSEFLTNWEATQPDLLLDVARWYLNVNNITQDEIKGARFKRTLERLRLLQNSKTPLLTQHLTRRDFKQLFGAATWLKILGKGAEFALSKIL